jgi:cellulase/cellobiase CelA1
MSLDNIVANDYGQVIKLTFWDVDTDAAADISGYTNTIQMILTDPDGVASTKDAAFDTDGSDGVIKYTVAQNDIDQAGKWLIRGKVTSGTAVLTSAVYRFKVLE